MRNGAAWWVVARGLLMRGEDCDLLGGKFDGLMVCNGWLAGLSG